jgi:hypothetical protein
MGVLVGTFVGASAAGAFDAEDAPASLGALLLSGGTKAIHCDCVLFIVGMPQLQGVRRQGTSSSRLFPPPSLAARNNEGPMLGLFEPGGGTPRLGRGGLEGEGGVRQSAVSLTRRADPRG